MKRRINALTGCLALLAATWPLYADGFRAFNLGARASSLGGAFVARADDVSAVCFNPAGLVHLPGLRLKINIQNSSQSLTARSEAAGEGTTFRLRPIWTTAFASYTFRGRFSLGCGVFPAQGYSVRWPEYWPFCRSVCRNDMFALAFRAAAAVKILDSLSVGVGLDVLEVDSSLTWISLFEVEEVFSIVSGRTISFLYARDSIVNLKGSGLSFNAGLIFEPVKNLRFGARYEQGASLNLTGDRFLTSVGVQRASLSARLPARATAGFQLKPLPRLSLQADVQWTEWSRSAPRTLVLGDQVSGMWGAVIPEGEKALSSPWRDTLSFFCGAEYEFIPQFFARAGYSRLPAAVAADNLDPFTPDLGDDVFALGLGYEGPFFSISTDEELGVMSVDVFAQLHRFGSERSALPEFPLEYSARRLTVGAGIGFIY